MKSSWSNWKGRREKAEGLGKLGTNPVCENFGCNHNLSDKEDIKHPDYIAYACHECKRIYRQPFSIYYDKEFRREYKANAI